MSQLYQQVSLKRRVLGFTLLEVLVALAILAISSLAVSRQIANSLYQQQHLSLKTTAQLLAENELSVIQLLDDWPSLGLNSREVLLANGEWQVTRQISSTSEPWLRKITITVNINRQVDTPLISLVAYRGRY